MFKNFTHLGGWRNKNLEGLEFLNVYKEESFLTA
jgi:hypothetical protein